MLTTNLRTTQTLDPCTGVAPVAAVERAVGCVRPESVTATAYRPWAPTASARTATDGASTRAFAFISATADFARNGIVPTGASWLANGRKPMPKVDLHPDRWPLQSTS